MECTGRIFIKTRPLPWQSFEYGEKNVSSMIGKACGGIWLVIFGQIPSFPLHAQPTLKSS
jgi:hypothetical protein